MSTPEKKGVQAIDPRVRMGHVHLKVADLERALGFYRDVLGFELMQRASVHQTIRLSIRMPLLSFKSHSRLS
jgi:catechol-2,3-dioxygenase